MSRYMQSEIERLAAAVETLEAKLERAEGQIRAMREDASRALGNAMRERDEAWLDAGTARAEERARIVKALREAAHGGNRGQPGSFWVGWRAAARAIEEGWVGKPETCACHARPGAPCVCPPVTEKPPCDHGLTGGRGADERCLECGSAVAEKPETDT